MDRCVRCGAELGVGRFCLNCGHPIGEPVPPAPPAPPPPPPTTQAPPEPTALPVQAADPTPVPPATPAPATPVRSTSAWDPREDLLPYQEVDDLERDVPVRGYAWIAWVLGAAALVGLVLVLLQALATGTSTDTATDDSATDSSASPVADAEQGAEAPTGVGRRMQLAATAGVAVPDTAPPTTDLDGDLVAYEASQMIDGAPSTTWRMAGDATGQTLTLTLAEPAVVQRVGLVNGYTKQVAGVDWYPHNRRILAVTWTFEDGSTLDQTFTEQAGLQTLRVPPVQTSTVGITITSVTPPGTGDLGRDYTAISEVSVIGRRAG